MVLNRIDPALFEACFTAWARSLRADGPNMIALDGKTLRRSGDRAVGQKPLHLVSVWASSQRLVLSQEAVDAKANEGAALLTLLERMPLKGALVTIDAIGATPAIAAAVTEAGGDDVLALKRNQPGLHDEVVRYFADPDKGALRTLETTEKDHGRIETRRCSVSHDTGWLDGTRRFPGEPRFRALKTLVKTTTRTDRRGKITEETRHFLSSAPLPPRPRGRGDPKPLGDREPALGARPRIGVRGRSSPSRKIGHACAEGMAPRTWPSCAASLSISSAPGAANAPSR